MSQDLRLIVVSGLSGSGKSVALNVLEDLGYYCIDNMPAALIGSVLEEVKRASGTGEVRVAVGVDARNRQPDLDALPGLIRDFKASGIQTDLLFLQATDDILLKRYSETRRRHPLASRGDALQSAIDRERALLGPVINAADLVIDTSRTSVYELAELLQNRVDPRKTASLSIQVESFGYKHGIPSDADFVFDLRCLPNPFWVPSLRSKSGLDPEVIEFLDSQKQFNAMFEEILGFLLRWIPEYVSFNRGYLTIAVGCTGGQHRSVHMTEKLAAALRERHENVLTRHSELNRQIEQRKVD
jgi:UPF0042 nucleotide-binding protein